jgi:predicted amidohydrolase YtcJ
MRTKISWFSMFEYSMVNMSLVRSGKIEAVGPHLHSPKGVRVIDGRRHTLLPGLIDAPTHIRSRQDLEQSLAFGVTTDLSMLMDLKLAAEEKNEQSANRANDRADLFSSGYLATAPGGHGTEYGMKFQPSRSRKKPKLG